PLLILRCPRFRNPHSPLFPLPGVRDNQPGGAGESRWPVRRRFHSMSPFLSLVESTDPGVYSLTTRTPGPEGTLPPTDELLRHAPSGFLFGWTQNVGMGLQPELLGKQEFLILSTHGGLRADDGSPVALGFHSGHYEVCLLVKAAAEEFRRLGSVPFAGA